MLKYYEIAKLHSTVKLIFNMYNFDVFIDNTRKGRFLHLQFIFSTNSSLYLEILMNGYDLSWRPQCKDKSVAVISTHG